MLENLSTLTTFYATNCELTINTHLRAFCTMSPWFKKGIDLGTIITLDEPTPSQWEIVKKLNEYDLQLTEEQHRLGYRLSLTATKLICRDPKEHTQAGFHANLHAGSLPWH